MIADNRAVFRWRILYSTRLERWHMVCRECPVSSCLFLVLKSVFRLYLPLQDQPRAAVNIPLALPSWLMWKRSLLYFCGVFFLVSTVLHTVYAAFGNCARSGHFHWQWCYYAVSCVTYGVQMLCHGMTAAQYQEFGVWLCVPDAGRVGNATSRLQQHHTCVASCITVLPLQWVLNAATRLIHWSAQNEHITPGVLSALTSNCLCLSTDAWMVWHRGVSIRPCSANRRHRLSPSLVITAGDSMYTLSVIMSLR